MQDQDFYNATIEGKLDHLLVNTVRLAERQDDMLKRMDKVEASSLKMETFVDRCNLGRKVLLWVISGLGSITALIIAGYAALNK